MINGNGKSHDNIDLILQALKCHEDELCNLKIVIAELHLRHDILCSEHLRLAQRINEVIDLYYSDEDYKPIIDLKSTYSAFTTFLRRFRFW